MNSKLVLPNGLEIADGTIVKLQRFPDSIWIVKFGWYTYNNRHYNGWYFCSVPDQRTLPINPDDLKYITAVSGKLIETRPEVPPDTPEAVQPPPPPPTPINPEYIPAFFSKADKALYDAAFISVENMAALAALSCRPLPDGKIVRVNNTTSGKPEYYIWSQEIKTWDRFEFAPSLKLAPDEKILYILDEEKLGTTLSISIERIDDVNYVVLRGVDGLEVSKFDATMFIENSSLKRVYIEDRLIDGQVHKFLVMEFELPDGTTSKVECDLTDVLQAYTAEVGGGLKLANYAFSIDNSIEPCSTLNTDQTLVFGQSISLNSVQYDNHGLVVGKKAFSVTMPSLTGTVGSLGLDKLLTYVSIDNTGQLIGSTIDITQVIDRNSTHQQIPTALAVETRAESAEAVWTTI